jgi:hypothetical protein
MATGVVLDPLAIGKAQDLKTALAAEYGVEASQKEIIAAAVHGATAAQLVGMLMEFTKAKAARDGAASA